MQIRTFTDAAKVAHFLLAPDEVPVDQFEQWLPAPCRMGGLPEGCVDMINECNYGFGPVQPQPQPLSDG